MQDRRPYSYILVSHRLVSSIITKYAHSHPLANQCHIRSTRTCASILTAKNANLEPSIPHKKRTKDSLSQRIASHEGNQRSRHPLLEIRGYMHASSRTLHAREANVTVAIVRRKEPSVAPRVRCTKLVWLCFGRRGRANR